MTLTELRYIVALAQEGNFSRAAERCSVSQPTLSVSIARLEDEFGVQLFERGKGFVSPSAVGRRVVEQAQQAIAEADKVRQIAMRGRDQLEGPLRLGVIHTIGPYLLPQLIQSLKRVAPSMPLAIEENMTATLADMLRDNEIDVVIIALPFANNCFRDQVLGACPQVSSPETDVRLGHSIGTIRCMVASGLGVSVLPEGALGHPYSNELISVIPFRAPAPSRRIALAWRAGFIRPKAIDALLAAVAGLHNPAYHLLA